jgi:hypothetical protein
MLTLPTNIHLKSPLAAAVVLSLAVAAGAMLTSLGTSHLGVIIGERSPAPQERTSATVARLESNVGALTRDIDFVTSRIRASIKRGDDVALDRLNQIDATIAALNQRVAGLQADRLMSAPVAARPDNLRSSLNDIAAHTGAIAAITKRLDRIEVKVGMATDILPVEHARHAARRRAPTAPKAAESPDLLAQTGVLFGLRPAAKPAKTLRVSTLRD